MTFMTGSCSGTAGRAVAIDVVDTDPLLGMALLYGQELTIQVIEGGAVSVRDMFQS